MSDLLELVERTGKVILDACQTSRRYTLKADQSPITQADLLSDQCIREGLQRLTPLLPIISEESHAIDFLIASPTASYWLVDPLDGTQGFIQGTDEFTINISLIENTQVILGLVYLPVKECAYFAIKGHAAYKKMRQTPPQIIHTRQRPKQDLWHVLISHHDRQTTVDRFLQRLSEDILSKTNASQGLLNGEDRIQLLPRSSALKFGQLAEGAADLYPRFGPTSAWDTAAGQCIVEAAGGQVIDFKGNRLRYTLDKTMENPPFLAVGDVNHPWSSLLNTLR